MKMRVRATKDDGVDEVGFEKLIKALGDNGLNEYDQVHLVALAGDDEDDEESEVGEDVEEDGGLGEVSDSEEGEEVPEGEAELKRKALVLVMRMFWLWTNLKTSSCILTLCPGVV
jgi:hypothetical protein